MLTVFDSSISWVPTVALPIYLPLPYLPTLPVLPRF